MSELFSPLGMITQILTMMLAVGSLLIRYRRYGQDAWGWPMGVSTGAVIALWLTFLFLTARPEAPIWWIWIMYGLVFIWSVYEAWTNLGRSEA